MKGILKILCILFIIFYCATILLAQSISSRSEIYTIEDGLSQTGVNCLIQDSKGFLWIGTQDGLDRYDGNSFQVFRHQPSDSTTICDNFIRKIVEDSQGNLWIATNHGLSMLSVSTGKFANYYNNSSDPYSLSSNELYSVYIDKKGVVWVKTLLSLEKFDISTKKFQHYFHYNNPFNYISGDYYLDIFEDSKERLWVGTKDGLNYFNRDIEVFQRFENEKNNPYSISDNRIKSIFEDKDGILWVGTENGLNKFDVENKMFTRFYADVANNSSLLDNTVNVIYEDKQGYLWIGTQDGYNKYDKINNTFTRYKYVMQGYTKYPITGVGAIIEDFSGLMWLGSYQGLVKIDRKPFKFKLYRQDESTEKVSANNVSSIFLNGDDIWVGTWGQGFSIYNRKTGVLKKHSVSNSSSFLKDDNIYTLSIDAESRIWIGTGNGVVIYDIKNNSFKPFFVAGVYSHVFQRNRIYAIYHEKPGVVWFATEHGLHKYDELKSTMQSYVELQGEGTTIALNTVYCITSDNKGALWMGTSEGLIQFNPTLGDYKHFTASKNGLSSDFVHAILCDSKGKIWAGTSSGLCMYNPKTDKFVIYSEKEGLPNNMVYAILDDGKFNLWLSTNKGLTKFNTLIDEFTVFDIADGLQSYEFNIGSAYKSKTGEMFFGGISGYNSFFSDSLKMSSYIPNVAITKFNVIVKGKEKSLNTGADTIFHIPYNVSIFNIEFAVLDYTYVQNNQYAYKLIKDDGEGEWVNIGNKHFATFSNLPPGKYTFKVKGANSDQVWCDKEARITIIIESPLWLTKMAITMYVILSVLLLYSIMQWRTSSLRKSNRVLKEKELAALEIARQKEELSIKNKNITDSINYAQRIQMAMMPSEKTFKKYLPNSFIYHRPKDIVSGDFYWIYEHNGKVFLAAVDCTGHGVPGAFMSILGFELFRNITSTTYTDPGHILSKINDDFSKIFIDMDEITLRDGMDIAFCVIDKVNMILDYAGAFNPLYIIRDNKIIETKGNRFSVSMEKKKESLVFRTHSIPLQKDDVFYIFSDGYADQFGGYEGKKFKYRRFKHLLLNIHQLPLNEQLTYIDESMEMWKGHSDQVDDILVIGVKADFDVL
jgi:ligand-binding sensor domain-containing protein/serine phosphatase RsbU (regulator of sigma subunit)